MTDKKGKGQSRQDRAMFRNIKPGKGKPATRRLTTESKTTGFPVGLEVGAERWPYNHAHPDAWRSPHKGVVLSENDPRAWQDTLTFDGLPTQAQVDAHLAQLKARGDRDDERVPVLWSFGRAYWERRKSLRPFRDDVRAWEKSRQQARQNLLRKEAKP
jgi:hypothetical protein